MIVSYAIRNSYSSLNPTWISLTLFFSIEFLIYNRILNLIIGESMFVFLAVAKPPTTRPFIILNITFTPFTPIVYCFPLFSGPLDKKRGSLVHKLKTYSFRLQYNLAYRSPSSDYHYSTFQWLAHRKACRLLLALYYYPHSYRSISHHLHSNCWNRSRSSGSFCSSLGTILRFWSWARLGQCTSPDWGTGSCCSNKLPKQIFQRWILPDQWWNPGKADR